MDTAGPSRTIAAADTHLTRAHHDTHLTRTLRSLLQPTPHASCLFLQATAHSDHVAALAQIRAFLHSHSHTRLQSAELHPHLIGSTVTDIQRDIEEAFFEGASAAPDDAPPSSSKAMRSAIDVFPTPSAHTHRIVVVPSAHLLRTSRPPLIWTQLLHPPRGYSVILLSTLPLERWKTPDGMEDASGVAPLLALTFAHGDVVTGARALAGIAAASAPSHANTPLQPAHLPASAPEEYVPLYWRKRLHAAVDRFKPAFIAYVTASLTAEVGPADVDEVRQLGVALWLALGRIALQQTRAEYGLDGGDSNSSSDGDDPDPHGDDPIWEDLIAQYRAKHGLISLLSPLIRSALREVHPRRTSPAQWAASVRAGGLLPASAARNTTPPLPPLQALLLLSAFLASHLPPKNDTRFFLRDASILPSAGPGKSRRRKRKRTAQADDDDDDDDDGSTERRTNSHPLLLGPRPFPLQRMLYIGQNLCVEFGVALPGAIFSHATTATTTTADVDAASTGTYSLPVYRALVRLVAAGHVVFLAPAVSAGSGGAAGPGGLVGTGGTGPQGAGGPGGGATARGLPPVPTRLEHLSSASLRCNALRDEVRALVLGVADEDERQRESEGGAAGGGAGGAHGGGQGEGGELAGARDLGSHLHLGLNPSASAGSGLFADQLKLKLGAGGGARTTTTRKDWWERVEECGL